MGRDKCVKPRKSNVSGLPPRTLHLLLHAFDTVPVGVMYATWSGEDTWFGRAGLNAGMVATSLPIGRIVRITTYDLRCTMSGAADVRPGHSR